MTVSLTSEIPIHIEGSHKSTGAQEEDKKVVCEFAFLPHVAGQEGLEPSTMVLETTVLPLKLLA